MDVKENKWLLKRWQTVGNGEYGEWSIQGAKDAVMFVDSGADLNNIMDWKFLKKYFVQQHGELD